MRTDSGSRFLLSGLLALACPIGACAYVPIPMGSASAARSTVAQAAPMPAAARPAYASPYMKKTRAELEGEIAHGTEGFRQQDVIPGRLETFVPVALTVKRGLCYMVAFELDEGVAFSDHAMKGVDFVFEGERGTSHDTALGPGGLVHVGCPNAAATIQIDMQAIAKSYNDKSRLHELGTGGFKATIYTKPINEKALAAVNEKIRKNEEADAESMRKWKIKEAQRKEEEAEAQQQRDLEWNQHGSGGPDCKRQCSATYTSCTNACGTTDCRGHCQTDEWKCKDACR